MKKQMLLIALSLLMFPFMLQGQGCMESTSEDGVQVIGYIQPQAEYSFLGNDLYGESLDQTSFYFNRARLGVMGNIPYDFSYYALFEFSPTLGGPALLDVFVSYNRFAPYFKASVGQFKSPFGLELSTPCHKLHTIDRSEVVGNLAGPFRDIGIMFSGTTGKLKIFGSEVENFFGYNIAIMNGTGMNRLDDNKAKDIVGRITVHPFDFITVGASYRHGLHKPLSESAEQQDERSRFGVDLELKYKDFLVQGEFIQGQDKGSYTVGGGCGEEPTIVNGSKSKNGFMVQAMYKTKWNIQPVIKFETFDPDLNMASGELEFNSDVAIHNTITYGVNYFFNEWTRVQINYLYRAEEDWTVEEDNDALLVQFQVVF